jgi:hypothetical protein
MEGGKRPGDYRRKVASTTDLRLPLDDYCAHMKPRSARWGTMILPAARFRALSLSACLA